MCERMEQMCVGQRSRNGMASSNTYRVFLLRLNSLLLDQFGLI